jgi:hypothetical protein
MVSSGGTHSAKSINIKGYPGIFSSFGHLFTLAFYTVDLVVSILSSLSTITGIRQYGQEIPRWLW